MLTRRPHNAARWLVAAMVSTMLCSASSLVLAQATEEGSAAEVPTAPAREEAGAEANAATPSAATFTLESDVFSVAVGEPFRIDAVLRAPANATLVSVRAANEPLLRLSIVASTPQPDGSLLVELEAVLFRPGTYRLAGLTALVLDGSGAQNTVASGALAIEVSSSIINEPDAAPVGSPRPFPVLTTDYVPIVLVSSLLVLLIGALVGVGLRRRQEQARRAAIPPPPPPPAWETALARLVALEHSSLLDDDRHLEFHIRLSEIFRAYIGARFNVPAIEGTTEEIRQALRARADDVGEWGPEIMRLLSAMDVVKFAKGAPTRGQSDDLLLTAREFVLELSARERAAQLEAPLPAPDESFTVPESTASPEDPASTTRASEYHEPAARDRDESPSSHASGDDDGDEKGEGGIPS